jgi:hypothetical protein
LLYRNGDSRPYIRVRYGEYEETFLALFDTGSAISYAQLGSLVTLTEEQKAKCKEGGLLYGSEWCLLTVPVEGIIKTHVHLGDPEEVHIVDEIHVASPDESRPVDYLIGAGPGSEFASKFPVFTFIPDSRHYSHHRGNDAGRIITHAVQCFTDRLINIRLDEYEWIIPGSVAINSNDEDIHYSNARILLDTGALYNDLPGDAFDTFVNRMAKIGHPVTYQPPNLPVVHDCTNIEKFPYIHIVLGLPIDGITVTLVPFDYVIFNQDTHETCQLMFRRVSTPKIVVGVNILSRFAIEFNSKDGTVGLCRI